MAVFATLAKNSDLGLKVLLILEGLTIGFAAEAIHRDQDCLGDDVAEFNLERFVKGISGACPHPHAFTNFEAIVCRFQLPCVHRLPAAGYILADRFYLG